MKVTLGGTLAPFWGYFGATLAIWTSNGRYDVYSCGFDGVIVRPKPAHKQEIHILPTFFACQDGPEDAKWACEEAGRTVWEGVGGG